jgi:thiol-activated cytolysin
MTKLDGNEFALSVSQYLAGLDYDPRIILSVTEDGATQAVPVRERTSSNNAVIIATKTKTSMRKNLSEVALLSPTTGVIYPGALILADEQLADGLPTPISLARGPATLSIDLPGLRAPADTFVPTYSSVQGFINAKLEEWNEGARREGYVNAARSALNVAQAFSSQQVSLELGFNAKWASGNASAQISASSSTERSVVVAYYKQVFYTVTMNTPEPAASVFADSVTGVDAMAAFGPANPPAYVRSVDYGRILMVKMESSVTDTSANLKGAFEQATSGGVRAGGSVDAKFQSIVKNSNFTVVALGGGAETPVQLFSGASEGELRGLQDYIKKDSTFRRDNPGMPITYQVAFLKDNRFAKMGFTTDYTETEAVRYPNGFVKVHHSGGYVAKFEVTWTEADATGNFNQNRSWRSGEKTAGYSCQIDLPGDARNVRLKAQAATGLIWDPWGEIFNVALEGPDNKCYRATGTTLHRTWDHSC